jgi:chromosome partitioning protein
MDMAKIISVVTHKGGVGKTSTSLNLADGIAREGNDVLLVDLDPQANATSIAFSYDMVPPVPVERVLAGEATMAEAIITNCQIPGVHLLGASIKLANLERNMQQNPFTSTRLLSEKLKGISETYDVIVVDCPPSLGSLTANALAAADFVIVPIESGSKLSLVGSDDMIVFIEQARQINPRLRHYGALLNKHDGRTTVCRLIAGSVSQYYETVFKTSIPKSTAVQQAEMLGKTILQFDGEHTVSRSFVELTRELLAKLGVQRTRKEAA